MYEILIETYDLFVCLKTMVFNYSQVHLDFGCFYIQAHIFVGYLTSYNDCVNLLERHCVIILANNMNNLTCLHVERESLSGWCFLPDYTLPNRLPLQTSKGNILKLWLYVQYA